MKVKPPDEILRLHNKTNPAGNLQAEKIRYNKSASKALEAPATEILFLPNIRFPFFRNHIINNLKICRTARQRTYHALNKCTFILAMLWRIM